VDPVDVFCDQHRLVGRQRQIVTGSCDGLTKDQLMRQLGVGPSTLDIHLERIAAKTGASGKQHVTRAVLQLARLRGVRWQAPPEDAHSFRLTNSPCSGS
jgi:DNA-binding CsgD family transcriptional regulator